MGRSRWQLYSSIAPIKPCHSTLLVRGSPELSNSTFAAVGLLNLSLSIKWTVRSLGEWRSYDGFKIAYHQRSENAFEENLKKPVFRPALTPLKKRAILNPARGYLIKTFGRASNSVQCQLLSVASKFSEFIQADFGILSKPWKTIL